MESDAELIKLWREGQEPALEVLLRRYEKLIFGYLMRVLGNSHMAEDAAQEAFLRIVKGLERYREQGQFKSWALRIAYREGLRQLRRQGSMAAEELRDDMRVDREALPGERMISEEKIRALAQAIDALPEKEKEVVHMRVYLGMPFKEIAEAVGCPINTALSRMHMAAKRLKDSIGK